ncbi:MAG: TrkH family potassium uptake protein [Planctomycetota bacterium]
MNKSSIVSINGILLIVLAAVMGCPLAVALAHDSYDESVAFMQSIGVCLLAGVLLFRSGRRKAREIGAREGFAVVALGWAVLSAFGALPFYLAEGGIPTYLDAFWETISGFTTTGASILADPEELPPGLLFWRSLTHWLGGMGIVVLTVAILPFLGAGGYQMLRAEVPGPTTDRLHSRITQTAKTLWLVYVLLTLVQVLLLWPAMGLMDSVCHSFGTLATGGFSTKAASLAHYDSVYVDVVTIVFMFLAGANFVLHFHLLTGRGLKHFVDSEFRLYTVFVLVATAIITLFLLFSAFPDQERNPQKYDGVLQCLRHASFQVVSVITTTGYGTADFDLWPNACRFVLAMLMVVGGCAGSTGGGVKVIRILVVIKYGFREIHQLIRPKAIIPVRIGGHPLDREVVGRVLGFMALYFVLFMVALFALAAVMEPVVVSGPTGPTEQTENRTMLTAFGAVLSTLGNVGPGFADVGATKNYGDIPAAGKLILIFCMLLGRLELYCVLIVLLPMTWRK